ncbi:Subtilase family protein [Amycolatopsis pretoriensis]|uniref:Subtilase family protein n=1 Tax=Amycolatopsis pretoriensis TaxID=218821 RepID=A0A1H5QX15_9PSEU|nr:S8 family serine peptidase [Amycolatopsis pretoriensis]SEF30680.1 Subtilase family protein [Amycolatopsis pretoriensis]
MSAELIIDARHCQLVVDFLGDHLQLPGARVIEVDKRLDLALVDVPGVAPALIDPQAGEPIEPIETVLRELRTQFGSAFGGWSPEMDKNNEVANVVTWPGTKGAANDPQLPVGPATWQRVVQEAHPGGGVDPAMGRDVRICVLDTHMSAHPDLAGAYIAVEHGLLQAGATPPSAGDGHATFVAGLVHAYAPAATLITDWFLNQNQSSALTWDVAKKLASLAGRGFDVVNLSFGSRTVGGSVPFAMRRAIEKLSADTLVVAAAGNHGATDHAKAPMWPAALPGVIAVGATGQDGCRAPFSPNLPWVECTAPGTDVLSTYLTGPVTLYSGDPSDPAEFHGFARWSGTSFAAAKVTGMIAARTVPERVSAKDAFNLLLTDPDSVVKPFEWQEEPE